MPKLATTAFLLACACAGSLIAAPEPEWTPLFTSDLSEDWELWYGIHHKSVRVPGYPASTSDNCQDGGDPIGLVDINNDPLGLVKLEEQEGKPVVHVSGQVYAGLTTKRAFRDYHVSLEFKWGEKKWEPRLRAKRDAGLLLHGAGEHGAFWGVWMASQECQIQEGDCGDWIPLAGVRGKVRIRRDEKRAAYDPESDKIATGGYIRHSNASKEKPHGEWNRVEAYALGDDMVFVINGQPNMAVLDGSHQGEPLTEGKIQLQSEAAEIFYRDLKIRPITEFPAFLAEHVRPISE